MSTIKKTEIAAKFISLHKKEYRNNWIGKDDLESVYHNIRDGLYGECRKNDEFFEIEISSHESKTGNPILFTF